jgi:hypothetical protein
MENLKKLNWTSQILKLGMVELESLKLDTLDLENGDDKPRILQIRHEILETFKLNTPELQI